MASSGPDSDEPDGLRPVRKLNVLLEAQLEAGEGGGTIFTSSLVAALGKLAGPERYRIITTPELAIQLAPSLSATQSVLERSLPGPATGRRVRHSRPLRPLRFAHQKWFQWRSSHETPSDPALPEDLSNWADVMHLTYHPLATDLPFIYTVHDIQHRVFPEFFQPQLLAKRERRASTLFPQAAAIVTGSRSAANEIVSEYSVPVSKMYVVYHGADRELTAARTPSSDEHFAFYPAITHHHKNHVTLLEALAILKQRGLVVPLVLTGFQDAGWPSIQAAISSLGLGGQIESLGLVDRSTIARLYHSASMLVFPSRYEGAGLPVLEAMATGCPVACSDIPPLREYGGEAPAYFDPNDAFSIAGVVEGLWASEGERRRRSEMGIKRAAKFAWEDAARTYRALYRNASGNALTLDDESLLAAARLT